MIRAGATVLLLSLCVFVGSGCGGSGGQTLEIDGDHSFDGMANPGSLAEAIDRFGYPDQLYGRPQDGVDCFANWRQYGIKALFQDWGAVAGGVPCTPSKDFVLTSVDLRGDWITDHGLEVGDSVKRMISIYSIKRGERCYDEVRAGEFAWTINYIHDQLGGPGSRLCTLGAIVAKHKVVGFVMSNQDASE